MSDDEIFPPYRPADWFPLQRALAAAFGASAANASSAFWFNGFVAGPADVGDLRLYEHSATRRHLVLDREGNAYRWIADIGGYIRENGEAALVEALV